MIVNFSHHEYLHLPKDHIVAFAEKDCSEGEVLELCMMEELDNKLPRNWIPKRKREEKVPELFENPFMRKKDEVPAHRKVLLEDKDISPKTQHANLRNCARNMTTIFPKTVVT